DTFTVLTESGDIYCFGDNLYWACSNTYGTGQLPIPSPMDLSGIESVVTQITAGCHASMMLDSTSGLWGVGANSSGGLGVGSWRDQRRPTQALTHDLPPVRRVTNHHMFSLWILGDSE
ncbi:hypothetical protein KIPB_012850, partial [Kipferlia bialata]